MVVNRTIIIMDSGSINVGDVKIAYSKEYGNSQIIVRNSKRLREDSLYRRRYANKLGFKFGFVIKKLK